MAQSVVRKAQSGSTAVSSVATEGATATAGNLLIAMAGQINSLAQISFSDDKGSTGWTTNATSAEYASGVNSGWMGWKIAVGGEKEIKATAGAGGTVQGVAYIEVSGLGASPTIDKIAAHNNIASSKEPATTAISLSENVETVFACVFAGAANTGTNTGWSSTSNAANLTNIATATGRIMGGYSVTGTAWESATEVAHFETAKATGTLIVAFKETVEGSGHVVTVA